MGEPEGVIWSATAELDLLAGVLAEPRRAEEAFERLTEEHFHDPVHGRIWSAFVKLHRAGRGLDPVVIAHSLGADAGFDQWGGVHGLMDLFDKGSVSAVPSLTDVLADMYTRRSIEALARDMIVRARDTADQNGDEILTVFEREAHGIAQKTSVADAWTSAGDMVAQAIQTARAREGRVMFPIGLSSVDKELRGLNAGEVTVIGGWTGMGKSIAGLQVAKGCGSQNIGVAYFSLEMSEVPMAMRMACDLAYDRSAAAYSGRTSNITMDRAIAGDLEPWEWAKVEEAQAIVDRWPIFFDMRPNLTVAQIKAATVRLHRLWAKHGVVPGPVIIDHIGKVKPSNSRAGSVTAETKDVSNDLMAMAKDLNVPMVVLTQLNRTVENGAGKDKRPTLGSVKDSGAVVEDARQLIFVYRPEYYLREPFEHEDPLAKAEREAELDKVRNHFYWIIEKNSNGPRKQVRTYCKADCSAVRDWNPA